MFEEAKAVVPAAKAKHTFGLTVACRIGANGCQGRISASSSQKRLCIAEHDTSHDSALLATHTPSGFHQERAFRARQTWKRRQPEGWRRRVLGEVLFYAKEWANFWRRFERIAPPTRPKPRSINAQVEGSGTADTALKEKL